MNPDPATARHAAQATALLLLEGPQRPADVARRLHIGEEDAATLLTTLGGAIRIAQQGDWWLVDDGGHAVDIREAQHALRENIDTVGRAGFMRPLPAREGRRLEALLSHFLSVTQPPQA